ncbi:MAG: ankyrin repeat domain-containing protein [Alphaproteobacteria bacterium]|nr:ankyrin repeat domain-containing protein [Alphaproteobacteria bacterium]
MKKFLYALLLILFPYVAMAQNYESLDFWQTATVQDIQPLLTPENINKKLDDKRFKKGVTYLMLAMSSKDPKVLEALIKAGADVNAKTEDGNTPIMGASSAQFVKILKKAGAKVNEKNDMGWTPLALACHHGNSETVSALIEVGADIHFKVGGQYNLLMVAAQKNPDARVTQTLLKAGFDINAKTKDGDTALGLAALDNPNPEVIEALVQAGADINAKSKDSLTPILMAAAHNPNPDVIDTLVKNGADINAIGEPTKKEMMFMTRTLSAAMVYNDNKEMVRKILDSGYDLNNRAPENISTAFMEVCPLVEDPQLIYDMVKKYGADIKAKTEGKESSVLMVCSMFSQSPDIIQALIDEGAIVNERTPESWTALMSAAANQNPEIVKVLIKNGADVRAKWKGGNATALMYACRINPNRDVILALIEGGSDIKAKDNGGKTAYDWLKTNPDLKDDQELLNKLR